MGNCHNKRILKQYNITYADIVRSKLIFTWRKCNFLLDHRRKNGFCVEADSKSYY